MDPTRLRNRETRRNAHIEHLLIGACAATVAIALGVATQTRKTVALDRVVRKKVRARRPRIVKIAKCVSYPAAPKSHPAIAIASAAAIHAATGRSAPAPVIASLMVFAIDRGTRLFIDQLRPPYARKRTGLDRFGFPSGHTTAGTAIAFATAMEAAKDSSPGMRAVAYLTAGACSAAVGWSRIALDEHWIDDVLGGWAFGIAIANVAVVASDSFEAHR